MRDNATSLMKMCLLLILLTRTDITLSCQLTLTHSISKKPLRPANMAAEDCVSQDSSTLPQSRCPGFYVVSPVWCFMHLLNPVLVLKWCEALSGFSLHRQACYSLRLARDFDLYPSHLHTSAVCLWLLCLLEMFACFMTTILPALWLCVSRLLVTSAWTWPWDCLSAFCGCLLLPLINTPYNFIQSLTPFT